MERQIDEMAKHCTYYSKGECYVDVLYPGECDLMCEVFGLLTNLEKAGYRIFHKAF